MSSYRPMLAIAAGFALAVASVGVAEPSAAVARAAAAEQPAIAAQAAAVGPSMPSLSRHFNLSEDQIGQAHAAIEGLDLPLPARRGLMKLLRDVRDRVAPPGIDPDRLRDEALCAQVAARAFRSAFGGEDDAASARGVSGDAWTMSGNVRFFGGESYSYGEIGERPVEAGDLLGMHYSLSFYNRLRKPADYTHIALVLALLPDDGPLILHAWHPPASLLAEGMPSPWPIRVELLVDFLGLTGGLFEPREVLRPRDKLARSRGRMAPP